MANEIEQVHNAAITNEKLKKQMEKITGELQTLSRVSLRICAIVARIQDEELYADDYTDFEDFGIKALNVKKSTLYNMAKAGREWTDGKGHSILWNGIEKIDYSLSQIYEIMRLKVRKGSGETPQMVAMELDSKGVILPSMKTSDIKAAVKAWNDSLNPKKVEEENAEGEGVETVATVIEDGQYQVQFTLKWLQLGNSYKLDVNGEVVEVAQDKWSELMEVIGDFMKA